MAKSNRTKTVFNLEEISTKLDIYISPEEIESVHSVGDQIRDLVINNPITNGRSVDEYRLIYTQVSDIWKTYTDSINNTMYKLPLSLDEKLFIQNYITKELLITPENIFIAMRVRDKVIKAMNALSGGDVELPIDIDNVTVLYHLIKGFTAKGIENPNVVIFGAVIAKIGAIERIYDGMVQYSKTVSELVTKWTTELDALELQIEGNVSSPEIAGPAGA